MNDPDLHDRDLIAMGRRHAQHAADEQPEIGCMRDVLAEVLDALEAAQRPPLGYAVVAKRPHRRRPEAFDYRLAGPVWDDRETADAQLREREDRALMDPQWYQNCTHLVAEVREVQP